MSTENPDAQLTIAIEKRDLEMTKQSIQNGADVNRSYCWFIYDISHTPLTAAVTHYPNFRIVQYLISQGANLYALNGNYKMAIQCSSKDSDDPITVLLKQKMRETINNLDENGNSPLAVYIEHGGNIEGVKMLIEMGANVSLAGRNGVSPLVRAVEKKNLEIIKYLLENGARPTATSALYRAIVGWSNYYTEDLQTLYNLGEIDINVIFKTGQTPLILSLQEKNTRFATYFIEQGANVDLADKEGNTPLILALKGLFLDMARKLVEAGCNTNISGSNGEIPIKICLDNSWLGLAMTLKEKGATVDDEKTFYVDLLLSGNSEVAEKIISQGMVNVNQKDDDGETVLSKCLEKSNAHLFKRLVEEAGGDINYKNKDGKSLLSLAAAKGDLCIVLYLIEKGANVQDAKGELEEFASWNDSFAYFFSKYQSSVLTIKGFGHEEGQDSSTVNINN